MIRSAACPACGPSLFVRLGPGEMMVRRVRCRATPVSLSLIAAIQDRIPGLAEAECYELSSRGALVRYLRRHAARLTISEYFEDLPRGEWRNGVQCQDVMSLTNPDEAFDLCTSTEVFEHVADDLCAFREVHRVLRPGGWCLFTVPLKSGDTVIRAVDRDGVVEHLLPPQYHSDRLRGRDAVLCYRDYGQDITIRLMEAGFSRATLLARPTERWFGHARQVVAAEKAAV